MKSMTKAGSVFLEISISVNVWAKRCFPVIVDVKGFYQQKNRVITVMIEKEGAERMKRWEEGKK